jgi:hypothetical protein
MNNLKRLLHSLPMIALCAMFGLSIALVAGCGGSDDSGGEAADDAAAATQEAADKVGEAAGD